MTNSQIADRLWAEARRLDRRDNLFRVRSYRRAAEIISFLRVPVADLLREQGRSALEQVPGIGSSLARSIEMLVQTGKWRTEERLRSAA